MNDLSSPAATILLVEDDQPTRRFLADNLCADGFEPLEAGSAAAGLELLERATPELAIVDLSLPDCDGLELITRVRRADPAAERLDPGLPLLVLSGRAGELDRLRGFERGADDFLAKPFSYGELLARVHAVLRRAGTRRRFGRLRVGALEVDPVARQAWVAGAPVRLSNKEFALLRTLAAEPTRVFTREELLRDVWGFRTPSRTLDAHALRLRQKLNRDGERYVINVWGVGYRLVEGPAPACGVRAA